MEDTIAYIILFGFGLGVLYAYQYRRLRPRQMPLSVQIYPDCLVKVLIVKQQGKIQTLIFRIIARKQLSMIAVGAEMIDKQRNIHFIQFSEQILPPAIRKNKYYDVKIDFEELKAKLTSIDKPFKTFRFVAENNSGKKYKSHELAFNKNWTIFRPDSGKYN